MKHCLKNVSRHLTFADPLLSEQLKIVLRLTTKAAKRRSFPVNHVLEEIFDAYLQTSGLLALPYWSAISDDPRESPLPNAAKHYIPR